MKISVDTVCHNSAATIGRTLDSFFQQDHADKQLVIVDGASSDGTLEIIAGYPQTQIRLISEPDRGIYDAMNKGLRAFDGEAMGYLNSDDCYHDHQVLSDIAAALRETDIVFGDIDFVADHETKRVVRRWTSSPHRPGAFRRGWMAPHPSLYVRRRVTEAVGEFERRYRISADYDWMLRAFEVARFGSRRLRRTFVDMLIGGASTRSLSSYLIGNLEALASRRRWLSAGLVDYALIAKPLGKVAQFMPGRAEAAR